ncbi:MAG: YjbQ family protein [Blastocatellia bacterium]|nr:YjbQ family protein [Blastocatellia bacterium]MBL8192826.1 YjbQ family protein [Blastocatellia bacterium]MBN8725015.1 YjbQ family protein [Acidobacteriota bacterium]
MSNYKVFQEFLEINTNGLGFINITDRVANIVKISQITTGLCTVFIQHTSASLIIQENADPSVLRDLSRWMNKLAPESDNWEHDAEGSDDMPAHARSVLTKTSENIPISNAKLALGIWQGLYLWEHRRRAHRRRLIIHIAGI